MKIYHSKFERNVGVAILSHGGNTYVSIIHNNFVNNSVVGPGTLLTGGFLSNSLVTLDEVMHTVSLSKFINNKASFALMNLQYHTTAENLTNNVFSDNSAVYDIFVSSACRPDFSLSLGNSHCIQCSKNWHRDLIGIVIAASIAGIALVIFMLALNMTVAVGTLNGILFYAHIVAANADAYFLVPDFVTVFISWLNLNIGLDVCFFSDERLVFLFDAAQPHVYKALLPLAFPAYVIFLVIIVIVTSECSYTFAKIISKGNPVAVLATMILLSYAKLLNTILTSFTLFYFQPAMVHATLMLKG